MKNLFLILCLGLLGLGLSLSGCQKESSTIDPCANVSCQNGGSCDDGTCDCLPNYSGANCQIYTAPDPCANIVCQNNGYCNNGACVCPNGWTGAYCQTQVAPTRMEITKITVTNFPTTQSDGSVWDAALGNSTFPDIFISLNTGATVNQNTFITEEIDNCDGTVDLVYTGSINNLPYSITDLSINWGIGVWDEDNPAQDDYLGGVSFRPIDKATNFPNTIIISGGNFRFELEVNWYV